MSYQLIDAEGKVILPYSVLNLQGRREIRTGGLCGPRATTDGLRHGILADGGRPTLPFEYDEITIFFGMECRRKSLDRGRRWSTRDGVQYSFDISKRDET